MTAPAEPVATPPVDATETPATPAAPSPANMPQTAQAAAEPTEGDDDGVQQATESAEIARLKREAQTQRAKRREEEQARQAAEQAVSEHTAKLADLESKWAKLNAFFNPDADTPPDPAQLAEQLAAAQAQREKDVAERDQRIRDLTIKASLPAALSKSNADPELTVDYLTASGVLAKLDPASATFAEDLESAVAAALEARPRLKIEAAPVVARKSGAPIPGRSGGSDQLTHEQVREMSKKDPAALVKAQQEGRLRSLGINPE